MFPRGWTSRRSPSITNIKKNLSGKFSLLSAVHGAHGAVLAPGATLGPYSTPRAPLDFGFAPNIGAISSFADAPNAPENQIVNI